MLLGPVVCCIDSVMCEGARLASALKHFGIVSNVFCVLRLYRRNT